jgi:hypothetical protein
MPLPQNFPDKLLRLCRQAKLMSSLRILGLQVQGTARLALP